MVVAEIEGGIKPMMIMIRLTGGDFHLKVDLPNFNGTFNIEEFLDWLVEVEHFFDYMDVPEERRVKTITCRLKGRAFAWWERL